MVVIQGVVVMSNRLEAALNNVLRNWGHDILLQRRTPDRRDWTTILERHTTRHGYPANRGLPQVMREREEGIVHSVDMLYYFRREAHPREGDRIYELDPRFEGYSGSNTGQTTWLIDYALPMRGAGGKIVYYIAGVTREGPN